MKKKITMLLALSMLLSLPGCMEDDYEDDYDDGGKYESDYDDESDDDDYEESDGSSDQIDLENNNNTDKADLSSGFEISMNNSDSQLNITRTDKKSTPMGDDGTWTIFVYLCGTDLESDGGAASSDITQMTDASGSDNVRFVFQTGGTSEWETSSFNSSVAERYVVQNGDLELVDTTDLTNMGSASTLTDFLSWGVQNYPADKMGVVFWDHGAGSINGVCFDELNDSDSLSLAEINSSLSTVYAGMTDQFEFIGFDACLMGTAETANILTTYARYMFGSEETEPGSGWDYTSIGNYLVENPSANGADLGKVVADSFYAECETQDMENECTFSIIDLSKFDDFASKFNDFSKELYTAATDGNNLTGIVRGIKSADNFGGNNKSEGYTNMVDLGGIVNSCADFADTSAVISALKSCVTYMVNGDDHPDATGLSIYYPLGVSGSAELKIFSDICFSPYYLSLVDMVSKGHTDELYTNDDFFDEDGNWTCHGTDESYDFDESYYDDNDDNSTLITFDQEPYINDEGSFGFKLDADGLDYTSSVSAYIYMEYDEGLLEIGETLDVCGDWSTGEFYDNFDGYWFSLGDGQLLATYIASISDDFVIYTSPITLNGQETNLRIKQTEDGITIEGAWEGIDENGAADRNITPLKNGDVIIPLYTYISDSDEEEYIEGEAYTWSSGDNLTYASLPEADYYYGFYIEDLYGDAYISDPCVFTIDSNGDIYFDEY